MIYVSIIERYKLLKNSGIFHLIIGGQLSQMSGVFLRALNPPKDQRRRHRRKKITQYTPKKKKAPQAPKNITHSSHPKEENSHRGQNCFCSLTP